LNNIYRSLSRCIIGNGATTCFWEDRWAENILANTFPRLASFSKSSLISVQEILDATDLDSIFFLPLSQQAEMELTQLQDQLEDYYFGAEQLTNGSPSGMETTLQRNSTAIFMMSSSRSSDQIEFTQARQEVKAQVTQLPMPLPQLTRRTSQETTLNTRRLRKISSKHLTLDNDHTDKVPSRVQNPRTTRPKQHLKTLIQKLGHKKQIVS
jgi:hypothetical protein